MDIKILSVGPIGTNCYILRENDKSIIIDPAFNDERIRESVKDTDVEYILLTHAHFDHIMGLEYVKSFTNAPILVHEADEEMLSDSRKNGSASLTFENMTFPKADKLLKDNDDIDFEGKKIKVIHTPGHTKGSVSFLIDDSLFCGDTLFFHSIGRYDLYGGNLLSLEDSIKNKLYKLSDDTIVYPGHGEYTTIGEEKKNNGFFRA